jgi:excisionase family DNA binding protein
MPKLRTPIPAPVQVQPPPVPPVPIADKAALTVLEAAELMSLGSTSVRLLIKANKLRAVRVGKALIIPRREIERYLEAEAGAPETMPKDARILVALAQARVVVAATKRADDGLRKAAEETMADIAAAEGEVAASMRAQTSAERAGAAS